MAKRYFIKSKITGKYLTTLFALGTDRFQSEEPEPERCYMYNNKIIANEIAQDLNAEVEEREI